MFTGSPMKDISGADGKYGVTPLRSWFYTPMTDGSINVAVDEWTIANNTYGNITKWNTSRVTDMSGLFQDASGFDEDISDWNVSNVTNMSYMFDGASTFNKPIGNWNVSKVTNMNYMFRDTSFNQSLDTWDIGSLVTAEGMFTNSAIYE